MKKHSVKLKITLWLTFLMSLLSALLLIFMMMITKTVTDRTAMEQLSRSVRANAAQISYTDGRLRIGDGFLFSQGGVTTLIYSSREALMAGQPPVSYTAGEPFDNGNLRTVDFGGTGYFLLDLWVPSGWDDGIWVRGLMEASKQEAASYNLLFVAAIALPLFILLAAAGGYLIVRRSFRPLDTINSTAAAINEASDLSRRIGLPPGKDEFSRLADTFDSLFARLERSFEAEKQFTADASHELRTPISIIKGACEYAAKYDETPQDRQETLDMIYRQTLKMSDLVTQLLGMTRLEQGTELPSMEQVDLAQMTAETVREHTWDPNRLHTDLAPSVTVRGDAALLARLLSNLVNNAFKYGREDSHVWISVKKENEEALLQVRDNGIGIPAQHQEHIWQRFYQVDPSRNGDDAGAGLGLAMVQQIARLHKGYMTLESTPGIGSTFTLHLPI